MRVRWWVAGCLVVGVCALVAGSYRLGAQSAGAAGARGRLDVVDEVYRQLHDDALRPPSDSRLAEGAIGGMLRTLDDRYAAYYGPADFDELSDSLDGTFSGVGLVLSDARRGVRVVDVLVDTPAAQAGIRVGDRIVAVDGRSVARRGIDHVVQLVQGRAGTSVRLLLEGSRGGNREVSLRRADIDVPNLRARLLPGKVGLVRLRQFTRGSGENVGDAVRRLAQRGAGGIILDLRGNPGGLLREAVAVAQVFVEDSTVVRVLERGDQTQRFRTGSGNPSGLPLAVLVDGGSASASEIVAGALQDLRRATLVGQKTYGKGSVQTVRPLPGGAGVKFTTAEYRTPDGRVIDGVGVVPDRRVEGRGQLRAARRALAEQVAQADR